MSHAPEHEYSDEVQRYKEIHNAVRSILNTLGDVKLVVKNATNLHRFGCSRVTLVLYRKRTARRFRLALTSGVRFRYSRQKEAARGCGGRGVLWEFNRFLPEKTCQTRTSAKTILLIFTM